MDPVLRMIDQPWLQDLASGLERTYLLALALQLQVDPAGPGDADAVTPQAFTCFALAAELVALVDDLRAALVVACADPGGS